MTFGRFILIPLMFCVIVPSYGGLPSSDQLRALRESAEKEMAKYFRVQNSWGKCMEVIHAKAKIHGAPVRVWDCGDGVNQLWKLEGAQLKLASRKCLQPTGDPKMLGTRLQIANCNNSPKQKWRYEKGLLKTTANTCIEVRPADLNKNGGIVQIAACKGSRHQIWKVLKK